MNCENFVTGLPVFPSCDCFALHQAMNVRIANQVECFIDIRRPQKERQFSTKQDNYQVTFPRTSRRQTEMIVLSEHISAISAGRVDQGCEIPSGLIFD